MAYNLQNLAHNLLWIVPMGCMGIAQRSYRQSAFPLSEVKNPLPIPPLRHILRPNPVGNQQPYVSPYMILGLFKCFDRRNAKLKKIF
jgi:hypothetical protein